MAPRETKSPGWEWCKSHPASLSVLVDGRSLGLAGILAWQSIYALVSANYIVETSKMQ